MLTEFWTSFYDQCSVGFNVEVPFLRHDVDWSAIVSMLAVEWVKQEHFPIKLSSVFMTCCKFNPDIYGPTSPDVKAEFILLKDDSEREILEEASNSFSDVSHEELIEVLDNHKARLLLTEQKIHHIVAT